MFGTTLRALYGLGVVRYYVIELGLSEFFYVGNADWNFEVFLLGSWLVWVVGLKIITN